MPQFWACLVASLWWGSRRTLWQGHERGGLVSFPTPSIRRHMRSICLIVGDMWVWSFDTLFFPLNTDFNRMLFWGCVTILFPGGFSQRLYPVTLLMLLKWLENNYFLMLVIFIAIQWHYSVKKRFHTSLLVGIIWRSHRISCFPPISLLISLRIPPSFPVGSRVSRTPGWPEPLLPLAWVLK